MATQDPFDEKTITDWLEALKSRSESPEVIALQRRLLGLLQRAARQLPEVQALVRAARRAHKFWMDLQSQEMYGEHLREMEEFEELEERLASVNDALKPFEDV